MDFAIPGDDALLVQTVRRFVDKDLRAWAGDADRAAIAPPRLRETARELGFFLDAVPDARGGLLDGPYSHLHRAMRSIELGRGCAAMAALLETNVEPALAIARWGSPQAQDALFSSLVAGRLTTTARDTRGHLAITREGNDLRVSGRIGPLPALADANYVLVLAHTSDEPVLFLLEATQPMALATSGWRAAAWATLSCEQALVPAEFVVARGDVAKHAHLEISAWFHTSLAARAIGVAMIAMEHAAAYAAQRVQFGQPIGQFESIIGLRDNAETLTQAARWMVLHAAWCIDRIRPNDETSLRTAAEAASRAKVIAGDAVRRATIDAVQIFGGYGFVNDYPVEKLMRDARAFEQLFGDERFERILAARA